jgi:hypothetical protein
VRTILEVRRGHAESDLKWSRAGENDRTRSRLEDRSIGAFPHAG